MDVDAIKARRARLGMGPPRAGAVRVDLIRAEPAPHPPKPLALTWPVLPAPMGESPEWVTQRIMAILRNVAWSIGLTVDELRKPSRVRKVARARHEAIWRIHQEMPRVSWQSIASEFGMQEPASAREAAGAHALRLRSGGTE